MNLFLCYFSDVLGPRNYAVKLEKPTASKKRDKGRLDSESYFYFRAWKTVNWGTYKKDFGERPIPVDSIERKQVFIALY